MCPWTVSDTASLDPSADRSGPVIQSLLTQGGYICTHLQIVPDDEIRIRTVVLGWCDQGDVDWIVTTGGTGFGVRDRTPEVSSLSGGTNALMIRVFADDWFTFLLYTMI